MLIHVNKASKTKFLNLDKNQLLKCQILQKFLKAKLSYKVMIQHLTCSDFKNNLCKKKKAYFYDSSFLILKWIINTSDQIYVLLGVHKLKLLSKYQTIYSETILQGW